MFASGNPIIYTVVVGAKIVKRVKSIPGNDNDSETCMFLTEDGRFTLINSTQVLPRLRTTVRIIRK